MGIQSRHSIECSSAIRRLSCSFPVIIREFIAHGTLTFCSSRVRSEVNGKLKCSSLKYNVRVLNFIILPVIQNSSGFVQGL
jgi:hypothetical protein